MIDKTSKEVDIEVTQKEIMPGQEIHGTVNINYTGRFDSIVINKEDLSDKEKLEFTAVTAHKPSVGHTNAKFRVAVVQEHKEVVSAVAFVKILR